MTDPFGLAIKEYLELGKTFRLIVNSNYTKDEEIPVSYLFRGLKRMPKIEQIALDLCKGKVLDIGAAAGCHSIVLQKKGFDVTALEKSELACDVLKKRGIIKVECADIYDYSNDKFDTLLLLMNGAGIGGSVVGLKNLLNKLKTLLNMAGQILIDSSDIKYLFEEEDGSYWIDITSKKYYGEMEYDVRYKDQSDKFDWLFIDFKALEKVSNELDFSCKLVQEGEHFEYLAKLKIK